MAAVAAAAGWACVEDVSGIVREQRRLANGVEENIEGGGDDEGMRVGPNGDNNKGGPAESARLGGYTLLYDQQDRHLAEFEQPQ